MPNLMDRIRNANWIPLIAVLFLLLPNTGWSGVDNDDAVFMDEIVDGFDYLGKIIGVGSLLMSDLPEPEGTERYSVLEELRLDVFLKYRWFDFSVKPRFIASQSKTEDEMYYDEDVLVNEWMAGFSPVHYLALSYGRENLQWGPSYFFSPSNPFFKDNGQTRSSSEIRGMDFAKGIWTPNTSFAMSLIANTDKGEQVTSLDFEPRYAVKFDFYADRGYFSLIGSQRCGDKPQLGGYVGWNASEALIFHTEWNYFHRLSPTTRLSQWQSYMLEVEDDDLSDEEEKYADEVVGIVLVGGSYTFKFGTTVTAEYVYNGDGLTDSEIDELITLANQAISSKLAAGELTFKNRDDIVIPDLFLLRTHYLMGQISQTKLIDRLNITLRYLYNLDDRSSRVIGILSCDIDNASQVFINGRMNFGSPHSEFSLLYDYSIMMGIEISF